MAEAERNQVFALGAQTIRQFKANGVNSSHYEIKPKGMEDPYQPLTLAFYAYGNKIVTYSTGDVFDGSVAETYADTTIYHRITLIDTLRQDTFIRKP